MAPRPMRWVPLAPLAVLMATAGCADGAAAPGFAVTTRDSAGVEIVENRGPEVPDSLVLREVVEELRIGSLEGAAETQLFMVMGVSTDPSGRVYVSDNGSGSVKVFGPDGSYVRAIGGRGEGPGEFPRAVAWSWFNGDTLAVFAGDRMLAFDGAGDAVVTEDTRLGAGGLFVRGGRPGAWIGTASGLDEHPRVTGQADLDDPLVRVNLTSPGDAEVLLRVPVRPVHPTADGRDVDWPLFAPWPDWKVAWDGSVVVHGGLPYEYRVYDPDGRLQRIVRREWHGPAVNDAAVDRYMAALSTHYDTLPPDAAAGRGPRLERTERRLAMPRPDSYPPLGPMVLGRGGMVWIQRNDLLHEDVARTEWLFSSDREAAGGVLDVPTRWDVFDPDGRFVAAVELPARFTLHEVDGDRVTGVQRDDMDVEYVVRYVVPGLGYSLDPRG